MHRSEWAQISNTARLIKLCIPETDIHLRGQIGVPLNLSSISIDHQNSFILFPSSSAQELNEEFLSTLKKPITLLVPDGTWRQARKLSLRIARHFDVPHLKLPDASGTRYRLRRNPKSDGVCTIEAIARALGLIENASIQSQLEKVFDLMVERTLKRHPLGQRVLRDYEGNRTRTIRTDR